MLIEQYMNQIKKLENLKTEKEELKKTIVEKTFWSSSVKVALSFLFSFVFLYLLTYGLANFFLDKQNALEPVQVSVNQYLFNDGFKESYTILQNSVSNYNYIYPSKLEVKEIKFSNFNQIFNFLKNKDVWIDSASFYLSLGFLLSLAPYFTSIKFFHNVIKIINDLKIDSDKSIYSFSMFFIFALTGISFLILMDNFFDILSDGFIPYSAIIGLMKFNVFLFFGFLAYFFLLKISGCFKIKNHKGLFDNHNKKIKVLNNDCEKTAQNIKLLKKEIISNHSELKEANSYLIDNVDQALYIRELFVAFKAKEKEKISAKETYDRNNKLLTTLSKQNITVQINNS